MAYSTGYRYLVPYGTRYELIIAESSHLVVQLVVVVVVVAEYKVLWLQCALQYHVIITKRAFSHEFLSSCHTPASNRTIVGLRPVCRSFRLC